MKIILALLLILSLSCCKNDSPTGVGGPADTINPSGNNSQSNGNFGGSKDGITSRAGTDSGGGGNHILQDVNRIIQNILFKLKTLSVEDEEARVLFEKFNQSYDSLDLSIHEDLKLRGKEVTAICT